MLDFSIENLKEFSVENLLVVKLFSKNADKYYKFLETFSNFATYIHFDASVNKTEKYEYE